MPRKRELNDTGTRGLESPGESSQQAQLVDPFATELLAMTPASSLAVAWDPTLKQLLVGRVIPTTTVSTVGVADNENVEAVVGPDTNEGRDLLPAGFDQQTLGAVREHNDFVDYDQPEFRPFNEESTTSVQLVVICPPTRQLQLLYTPKVNTTDTSRLEPHVQNQLIEISDFGLSLTLHAHTFGLDRSQWIALRETHLPAWWRKGPGG